MKTWLFVFVGAVIFALVYLALLVWQIRRMHGEAMPDDAPRCSLSNHEGRQITPTPEQAEREKRRLYRFLAGCAVALVSVALFVIL